MAFWKKAEKLVTFQYQREMERKKKVVLDKHLEFLVGQTERCFAFYFILFYFSPADSVDVSRRGVGEVNDLFRPFCL